MKAHEIASSASTITPSDGNDTPPILSTDFRPRASSLDIPGAHSNASNGWLVSFARRSSVDFTELSVSPGGSLEDLVAITAASAADDDQPRSRHGSGDSVISSPAANQSGGMVGHPGIINRRKSDSGLWKWSMFHTRGHDIITNKNRISESDEGDSQTTPNFQASETKPLDTILSTNSQTIISKSTKTNGTFGIMKMARKMSARDLNALCPTGEM